MFSSTTREEKDKERGERTDTWRRAIGGHGASVQRCMFVTLTHMCAKSDCQSDVLRATVRAMFGVKRDCHVVVTRSVVTPGLEC